MHFFKLLSIRHSINLHTHIDILANIKSQFLLIVIFSMNTICLNEIYNLILRSTFAVCVTLWLTFARPFFFSMSLHVSV
jgi:hypothetical protein